MSKEIYKPLETIDSQTLMETPLTQPKFYIESLLCEGVHILCGAPKTGKSWLVLWICDCIAKGLPVWNFPTVPSTVLYLCLEDSRQRIQSRLLDIADEWSPELFLAEMSGTLKETLPKQIKEFTATHPATHFVVIDTLQKIRTPTGDNAYASDYSDISILKDLSKELGLCIVLVHHVRKEFDDDPFNMVSGTNGITGAVDSSFVLIPEKRGRGKAVLHCTGRDIETRELEISFDSDEHLWKLEHDSMKEPERSADPVIASIVKLIKSTGDFSGTASELLSLLPESERGNLTASALSKKVVRYQYQLEELGVHVERKRNGESRTLSLSLIAPSAGDGNDGNDVSAGVSEYPSLVSQPSQPLQIAADDALESVQSDDVAYLPAAE